MDQLSQNASDAAQDADYILPNSSTKYLSESDLSGMSADELQMAINEIYARHHRKFVTKSIQQYLKRLMKQQRSIMQHFPMQSREVMILR